MIDISYLLIVGTNNIDKIRAIRTEINEVVDSFIYTEFNSLTEVLLYFKILAILHKNDIESDDYSITITEEHKVIKISISHKITRDVLM